MHAKDRHACTAPKPHTAIESTQAGVEDTDMCSLAYRHCPWVQGYPQILWAQVLLPVHPDPGVQWRLVAHYYQGVQVHHSFQVIPKTIACKGNMDDRVALSE